MIDTYSKRNRKSVGSDAYQYDQLPETLKNQLIHICNEVAMRFAAVGMRRDLNIFYLGVQQALCRELGLLKLTPGRCTAEEDVWEFFLREQEAEPCLDLLEVVFACMIAYVRANAYVEFDGMERIRVAVEEVNARFQEHAIGYEFRGGKFIRISSTFMHAEAVAPAMTVLHEAYLAGANQEFNRAHEHYRHQRYPECLNECLKAFESTMKGICDKRGWLYNQTATANQLMDVCRQNNLFPAYMETSLSGLRSALMNVATVRNKLSGHGQGSQRIQVTEETAAYMLHSTAANILFLSAREKLLP